MRVLVIAPKPPQPDGKGYAIRTAAVIAALQRNHEVDVFVPAVSLPRRILAGLRDLVAGRPAQVGYCMPVGQWQRAVRAAVGADAVIVTTVRALRGPLPVPVVLDHVDPLSLTWAQRARGPEGILRRRVAGLEADRLRRWERTAASWSAAQLILTDRDADALPQSAPVHVVPHVVVPPSLPARDRDIDVVFTGNMGYPPNRTAAMWLDREIAPELWRLRPGARIVVAGRDAHRLRLRRIERLSDVSSIPEILARARVAIVPLTQMVAGVPTKALEAALCGAALVVTPSADQRLALPARVAEDAAGLAAEVAALLDDPAARDALADEARCAVAGCGLAEVADQLDRLLASLAAENEPVLA